MAIDTATKRRMAGGVPFLPLGPGVAPDVTKPLAWRVAAAWDYVQIGAPPVTGVLGDEHILLGQRLAAGTPFDPTVGGWQPQ